MSSLRFIPTLTDVCFSQPSPLKTIEGTLFQALATAGAVSEDNADDPVKVLSPFHVGTPE
jgi:hypothetical protein